MSLSDRLARIEARLTKLEQGQAEHGQAMDVLVDALEQEQEPAAEPMLTLDGEDAGGDRDQGVSLDG